MEDDDLYKLEKLSLVNKIAQEITNHTGLNDPSVAEFVISIHEKSKGKKDKFI
ncbi:DEAH-box ATP-dependent RNA helicase prp22, partial [Tulasnella sp. 417]